MNKKLKDELNKYGSIKEPFLCVISYDLTKYYIKPLKELPSNIKYEINENSPTSINDKINLTKEPISFKEYKKRFDYLQENIKAGNSYLLNLTSKTKIEIDYGLEEIYKKAKAKYKLKFFDDFVCFSPEKFIEIKDNNIFTYPMKGTIDSNIVDAKNKILNNKKEMAEHIMVVDLLRNDLGMVANKIRVEKFRYIDKINAGDKELLQVSSKISGELEKDWNKRLGDILISLLPAGSITGTPKIKTVDLLEKIEDYDREFYTGIFGVFDGKSFNSAVMIRFIQKDNDGKLFYKSGGGITCDSIASLEYQELIDKIYLPF